MGILDIPIVASIAEPLRLFTEIEQDEFDEGIVLAAVDSEKNKTMHQNDILTVLRWANRIQCEAAMLYLMVSGQVQVGVIDGKISFSKDGNKHE